MMSVTADFEFDAQAAKHRLALYEELLAIRQTVETEGKTPPFSVDNIHDDFKESALNLLHYLSLRRFDLRSIQNRLSAMGLSSLGGSESCVLSSMDRVLTLLEHLLNEHTSREESKVDYLMGKLTLEHHSNVLLGAPPADRPVRIMVTMPSEAADDYTLIHTLLKQGMDCMRINCAHDDPSVWQKMILNLRRAEKATQKSCRIAMDLGGPKLRTGPIHHGPEVIKVRPKRNAYGWVVTAARIWLTAKEYVHEAPSQADAQLCVPQNWLAKLELADEISLRDSRGAKRLWKVVDVNEQGVWVEATDTVYVTNGLNLIAVRSDLDAPVSGISAVPQGLLLKMGDTLIVTGDPVNGSPATYDSSGKVLCPAKIGCTLPGVLAQVKQGEAIWFDDGKIGGVIEQLIDNGIVVKINRVRAQGRILRADKGINLPESILDVPALTEKDREDLKFVAQHADIVALSFVNNVADVGDLMSLLREYGDRKPGIVLKIETRQGFVNLPRLLLKVMQWPSCGIMIARGDLAVECGFERLAEVQEEILWLCEAAHVPVIWATQVLESLAKDGLPSRAEISDAAMGHRAECVMLNKGPHIDMAVRVLGDILERMKHHQTKKRSMMRRLQVAMFP